MTNLIEITLDEATMARVHAHAALGRRTLVEIVNEHLRSVGDDFVEAALPNTACQPFLVMRRLSGRDSTACYLQRGSWDEFERPMPGLFFAWARRFSGLIVDGGANTGFYSLLAATASVDNQVLAFEPDPFVRGLLRANVQANSLGDRIAIREAALSGAPGKAALYVPSQEHGLVETSSSLEERFKSRHSHVIDVETTTLDVVAAEAGLPVSLIKLDLASHEAVALKGAERTISRFRPVVFLEVLDGADVASLSALIARHTYLDIPLRQDRTELMAKATVTIEPNTWNHALVPAEKVSRLLLLTHDEV